MRSSVLATSATAVLALSPAAWAQQTDTTGQSEAGQQVAEQCVQDVRDFNEEVVGGPGMIGPGYGIDAPAGAWRGAYSPRRELNAVLVAADVFARKGMEEACQSVLEHAREMYEERRQQMEEAGVSPDEVRGWRHEQLVTAQPVEEVEDVIRIDDVIGADVRNMQDEDLGDIDDVVLGDDGTPQYVLISHGGFLGLGEDRVAVPWEDLQAVPQLDAFVLDVSEDVVENAPTVDRETFANLEEYGQRQSEIDSYWDQELEG